MASVQGSRSAILARIQKALSNPAAPPPGFARERARLLPLDEDPAALRERFRTELEALHGRLISVPDEAAAASALVELAQERGWRKWAVARGGVAASVFERAATRLGSDAAETAEAWVDAARARRDDFVPWLGERDVGVTGCDAWIAHTGSILISPRSGAGRALSVLPPVHVVIGSWAQLVVDLDGAFERLRAELAARGESWPSWISVISGPSRTADIEKILVLGAHGPRELIALVCDRAGPEGAPADA